MKAATSQQQRQHPAQAHTRTHSRVGAMGACTHSPPDCRRTTVMRMLAVTLLPPSDCGCSKPHITPRTSSLRMVRRRVMGPGWEGRWWGVGGSGGKGGGVKFIAYGVIGAMTEFVPAQLRVGHIPRGKGYPVMLRYSWSLLLLSLLLLLLLLLLLFLPLLLLPLPLLLPLLASLLGESLEAAGGGCLAAGSRASALVPEAFPDCLSVGGSGFLAAGNSVQPLPGAFAGGCLSAGTGCLAAGRSASALVPEAFPDCLSVGGSGFLAAGNSVQPLPGAFAGGCLSAGTGCLAAGRSASALVFVGEAGLVAGCCLRAVPAVRAGMAASLPALPFPAPRLVPPREFLVVLKMAWTTT